MKTPHDKAIFKSISLAFIGGLVAYFCYKKPYGGQLDFLLTSLFLAACIIGSFYALHQVRCGACGEHWLFKGANTGQSKSQKFQENVKNGICPYCGGSLS